MGTSRVGSDPDRIHPHQTQKGYADTDAATSATNGFADTVADNDAIAVNHADTVAVEDANTYAVGHPYADSAGAGTGADDDPVIWNGSRIDRFGRPTQVWQEGR